MIECFNDVEVRSSGVIMSSVFDQIKKMYAMDPDMAGELAISAIELVLTGQISSDDAMIDMLLAPAKVINDHNVQRYENRKEGSKNKKIKDMKLDEIAEMLKNGMKQKEIAERLHISQQTVSYRMGLIRTQYPELMQDRGTETAQTILPKYKENLQGNSDVYQNTNNFTNIQTNCLQNGTPRIPDESPVQTFYQNSECLPKSVQTKIDIYQKTKNTKNENLVILQGDESFVKSEGDKDDLWSKF